MEVFPYYSGGRHYLFLFRNVTGKFYSRQKILSFLKESIEFFLIFVRLLKNVEGGKSGIDYSF